MDKNTVKNFYDNGLWSIILVKTAVRKGVITKEEFKEITGQNY